MMQCQQTPDAERYVTGAMAEPERSAFEDHFLGCNTCFQAVQALQDASAVLADARQIQGAPDARTVRHVPYKWLAMAATIVLAVAIWNLAGPDDSRELAELPPAIAPGLASQPAAPATVGAPAQPAPAEAAPPAAPNRLDRWASVSPPRYVPLTTRSAPDAADEATQPFNEAMAHYSAGRYRQAADGLGALAERQPDAAHVHFFLGISELMSNNVSRARGALQRSAESGVSPYADEAHFYLAKAALRAGDLTTAARELQIAVERDAGPDGDAAKLLAEVSRAVK